MTNNRKQQEKVYFSFLFNNLSKTPSLGFNKYKVPMTLAATQTKQKAQYKTEGCHINPPQQASSNKHQLHGNKDHTPYVKGHNDRDIGCTQAQTKFLSVSSAMPKPSPNSPL